MKKKYFYSHIIEISEISISIAEMDMPNEDRVRLIKLAQENLHHTILFTVLSELSKEDQKTFLTHLGVDDHEKAWQFVTVKIYNAQDKIIDSALKFKKELMEDIEKAKNEK